MPLQIIRKNIVGMRVDAVVNPTNEEMLGEGGVDCGIHRDAGPELEKECAGLEPLAPGQAVITKGYRLEARYIIHTVGPIWHGGEQGESETLRSCYLESLKLAEKSNCESVAFPLISSGTYGFPKDRVLRFAVQVITEFLQEHEMEVYLCVDDRTSYEFSKKLYDDIVDAIGVKKRKKTVTPAPKMMVSCLADSCVEAEEDKPVRAATGAKGGKTVRSGNAKENSIQEYLKTMDKPFACRLLDLIDEKGMTDVECYRKANVDRRTFSKIRSNPTTYKPSKQTAVAFAIALRLNYEQTQELLATAGMTLSRSFTFDKIIEYFIQNGVYDIYEINQALFEFDQVCLGC